MGIMVYSLLWVMQDLHHQPAVVRAFGFRGEHSGFVSEPFMLCLVFGMPALLMT